MKKFINPEKQYAPIPFWSWNDKLEKEELISQIEEIDEKGLGGFFMHSRKGLVTPYLSDEWMEVIKECVSEAKKRGMGAWLYDEDKWPSGFCGGKIPKKDKSYRQKALLMRENSLEVNREEVDCIAVYVYKKDALNNYFDIEMIDYESRNDWENKGYNILYFYKWTQPIGPNRFNNTSWVDLLNPEVTREFIESTHEKYKTYVGEEFGKSIPGIFTDESTILYWAYAPKGALPWSENFEKYFIEYKQYNIIGKLPYLYIDIPGYETVRYDYWDTITHYFAENYVKPIYEWCSKNNLKYTGHFMAEDYFEFTMQYIGSLMPLYEYMHIPGVDHLNRNINDIMGVKQVTSVAHQLGKSRSLCEMFGCSGQNFSFEGQKWVADWNFIHGINVINPHLSLYSLRGERKRDYPPNLFIQQPWWKFNKKFTNYCSRLSYMLTRGERVTDLLVIHPIESAWCSYNPLDVVLEEEGQFDTPDTWIEYKPDRNLKVNELSYDFDELITELMKLHYDYDLGDETIISRHGKNNKGLFYVGEKGYKYVLVPSCITLRKTTAIQLLKFTKYGGKVLFIGKLPYLIDGNIDENGILNDLFKSSIIVNKGQESLENELDRTAESNIKISGEENCDVWYHLRRDGGKIIAFFANTNNALSRNVTISIKTTGEVKNYDLLSGDILNIQNEVKNGWTTLDYHFSRSGSLMVVIDEEKQCNSYNEDKPNCIEKYCLMDEWEIVPHDFNSLTLDYCACTINGVEYEKAPVHRIQNIVMEKKSSFGLSYSFEVKDLNINGIKLVVETPETKKISVNGYDISNRFNGEYYVDKSFRTAQIGDYVKQGLNIVEIESEFTEPEIEAIYINGPFEVENINNERFLICGNENIKKTGNLVKSGYPFYSGSMEFKQHIKIKREDFNKYILKLKQRDSIVVQALVNGEMVGQAIWSPYEFDITKELKDGDNEISIILTTSLHNLLGPHHSKKGEVTACAPASFSDEKNWTDRYNFVEFSIASAWIEGTY